MDRKLASVRRILELRSIDGADLIELAVVDGWSVVVKKGDFNVGDLVIYFEIDSWIPHNLAPFLSKGKEPREYKGIKGEKLRSVRLRGQLSQGLIIPLTPHLSNVEGEDLTEILGIIKWEKELSAQLQGTAKGNFPGFIPKTDQERVQNLRKELSKYVGMSFEVTEKLEGSSMTVYMKDGEFGVCSRNLDLKDTEGNTFWETAKALNLKAKFTMSNLDNIAFQGELIGPGIQGNIYKLDKHEWHVFDVYNIATGRYLTPKEREFTGNTFWANHVPIINSKFILENDNIDELLAMAEGKSMLNLNTEREGIVFKSEDGKVSFKAVSNKYLLGME